MPTAIIAEDELLLRAQLKARLREAWPELTIVAEAGNGVEALRLIDQHDPRCSSPRMMNTRSRHSMKAPLTMC